MVLVTFVLSFDLLWGYSMVLDPEWFTSIEAITACVQVSLSYMFRQNGLDILYEKCKGLPLHIHDHTIESLKAINPNSTVYICDHQS